MDCCFQDTENYKDIPLLRMVDNRHGNLPFFIRKYSMADTAKLIHRHEYMQINYVYRGNGKHYVNHHEFDIIKGDIFVIPPFVPHCIMSCPDTEIDVFEFEFETGFINQSFSGIENTETYLSIESAEPFLDFAYIEPFLVSEAHIKPRLNLTGRVQMDMEGILNEALAEYNGKESGYILLIKSLLLKLLVIVGREFTKDLNESESQPMFSRHRDAILGAVKYINEHYMEELSVDEVSRKFMLSPSYFRYLFKSITSRTFTEHLNSIRILKAMEMLKTSDKRVLDISCETGFNNVNHFNKVFRQQTGVTPLQYRKGNTT